ncbi:MAG: hypothetical protein AAFR35_06570 [Pseudomonadota bacterium]
MRLGVILLALTLTGCGEVAFNTTVADRQVTRFAMLSSVQIGETTERQFVTRWGLPTQKVLEGGRTEYIYRNMRDDFVTAPTQFGDSLNYVIVTFEYGVAIGARSGDFERCRGTFAPRPPGYGFTNPSTVHVVGACGSTQGFGAPDPAGRPGVPDADYGTRSKRG